MEPEAKTGTDLSLPGLELIVLLKTGVVLGQLLPCQHSLALDDCGKQQGIPVQGGTCGEPLSQGHLTSERKSFFLMQSK